MQIPTYTNPELTIMRKIVLPFVFLFAWLSSFCQDFPAPTFMDCMQTANNVNLMVWQAPEGGSPSHYNIYHYGDYDGLHILLDSTTDTCYSFELPLFAWCMAYGVSAVYSNPDGESDTLWCYLGIPSGWLLPEQVDFETLFYRSLVESVAVGDFSWSVTESTSFSPDHSAAFIPEAINYRSSLRTPIIWVMPYQSMKLSFAYKVPQHLGSSDTLRLYHGGNYGPWTQIGETYHSTDEWQLATFTFDPGVGGRFSFTATAGGGAGVFIDDIVIEDISTGIAENKNLHHELRISPNPARDHFSIQIPDNLVGTGSQVFLQVYDLHGRLHYSQRQNLENNRLQVNTAHWPEGLYMLRLVIDGAAPMRAKVMVVR